MVCAAAGTEVATATVQVRPSAKLRANPGALWRPCMLSMMSSRPTLRRCDPHGRTGTVKTPSLCLAGFALASLQPRLGRQQHAPAMNKRPAGRGYSAYADAG